MCSSDLNDGGEIQLPRAKPVARAKSGAGAGLRMLPGAAAAVRTARSPTMLNAATRDMANAGTRLYVDALRLAKTTLAPEKKASAIKLAGLLGGLRNKVIAMERSVAIIHTAVQGAAACALGVGPQEAEMARNSQDQAFDEAAALRHVADGFLPAMVGEIYLMARNDPYGELDDESQAALASARRLDALVNAAERMAHCASTLHDIVVKMV